MGQGRSLEVVFNGQVMGDLTEAGDIWAFGYRDEWLASPNAFALSPAIDTAQAQHVDGSTQRPLQWFFDNLLPEEGLRLVVSKEQKVPEGDAFGLLARLGAESAGSLVLRSAGEEGAPTGSTQLTQESLSGRIRGLGRTSLNAGSPKRMSLAGAQHKMVVLYDPVTGELREPLQGSASSHILKPNSTAEGYPHSVINEVFTMRLARRLGLNVPQVHLLYVPEPVYIIDRFDRELDPVAGEWQRLHVLDACQLLNLPRRDKYQAASIATLKTLIGLCREKMVTRVALFQWLVFNTLIGNSDAHLKNLSFLMSPKGVQLAPFYDLLSTAVYHTRVYADEHAVWPRESLVIPLGGASTFEEVTHSSLVTAGVELGLAHATAQRIVGAFVRALPKQAAEVAKELSAGWRGPGSKDATPGAAAAHEHLLRAVRHIVIGDTVARCNAPATATRSNTGAQKGNEHDAP